MYESFFGLRERPFDLTPNPRFLILTEVHREALSNLEYGIASRRGITLLVGDAGCGKTTLIRAAIARQPTRVHCAHITNPALTRCEFVEMLALRLGLSAQAGTSKATLLAELETLVQTRRRAGETTVLIVDEAQSLSRELLEEIRLLANIETDDEKLLSVILAGQPELAAHLNDPSLRQLKQRVALRCEMRPLTIQETATYIAGRIHAAGGAAGHLFTREAVARIHERSRGIPRTINVIADNALVSGFALQHRPITSQVVAEVCRDFDLAGDESEQEDTRTAAPAATVPPSAPSPAGRLLVIEEAPRKESPADEPAEEVREPAGNPFWSALYAGRRFFSR